jgi:hypothetical protein
MITPLSRKCCVQAMNYDFIINYDIKYRMGGELEKRKKDE